MELFQSLRMAANTRGDSPPPRKAMKQGASVGSLFSQTLQDVTNTKLSELTKKRTRFEEQRQALLARVETVQDPIASLETLVEGIRECFSIQSRDGSIIWGSSQNPALEQDLAIIERFLEQARFDPCITSSIREGWKRTLMKHLDAQSLTYSYAALHGELTTEWLSARKPHAKSQGDEDIEMDDYEHVSTARKLEARSNWEKTAFTSSGQTEAAIEQMLRKSFEPADEDRANLSLALKYVRSAVHMLEADLAASTNFTADSLVWIIQGLLASDLLSNEKREVLREFHTNTVILNEIADVLNMWMTSLDTWTWGDAVGLEQRRQLNGIFSIHMHEDVLQAIFLQYIGVKWSVTLKKAFRNHYSGLHASGVWKSPRKSVPTAVRRRMEFYLGPTKGGDTVESQRDELYRSRYFLAQLQTNERQSVTSADGEQEADYYTGADGVAAASNMPMMAQQAVMRAAPPAMPMGQQEYSKQLDALEQQNAQRRMAQGTQDIYPAGRSVHKKKRMLMARHQSDEVDDWLAPQNPMDSKQKLLHLLSTEILINVQINGQLTCVKSHLQDFYPTLPHEAILATMKFYGASKRWIQFFARFLQPPLRFLEDESQAEPRLRKRGTPGSHALSEMFGEAILFALDFQINQNTGGERLWRMHDEFWFWSAKEGVCETAWGIIESFSKTMGLQIDPRRSGSARIGRSRGKLDKRYISLPLGKKLPRGDIRWGMLVLNPESGRFEIDESMVDTHIKELTRQLKDKSSSVFAWVQAWNTYATTFFTSNFGKPANCFGLQHVDNMLATHKKIQEEIFAPLMKTKGQEASVVEYLRQEIDRRFKISDIPDGYVYFPAELGGLDIRSPFVALMPQRHTVVKQPEKLLDEFESTERTAYRTAQEAFDRGSPGAWSVEDDPAYEPEDPSQFLSFEEFTAYREQLASSFHQGLGDVFRRLLAEPVPEGITTIGTPHIISALSSIKGSSKGIHSNWYSMDEYWKWIAQLYGPEIIDQFGGFNIVDPRLLPIGMVGLYRSGRVQWQD